MKYEDIELVLSNPFTAQDADKVALSPYQYMVELYSKSSELPPACNTLVTELNDE